MSPMQQTEKTSELVDMQEITETQSGQDDTEVTATQNMSQNMKTLQKKMLQKCHLYLTEENNAQATENTTSENDYLPMVMAIITMSSCRTECHTSGFGKFFRSCINRGSWRR